MNNNNFIIDTNRGFPKQILRQYQQLDAVSLISAFCRHQDDNCPCIDVELEQLNRRDKWQWQEQDEADDGYERTSKWVMVGNEPIDEDKPALTKLTRDTLPGQE